MSLAPLFFDHFMYIVGLWIGKSLGEIGDGLREGVKLQQSAKENKNKAFCWSLDECC